MSDNKWKKAKIPLLVTALLLAVSAPFVAKVYYSGDTLQIHDGTAYLKQVDKKDKTIKIEEEEEEEQVFDPFNTDKGIAIPNQPLNLPYEIREQMRAVVENHLKASKMRLTQMERDPLNAILFNYGLQLLDDGRVIILDTYVPGAVYTRPMLTDDIPMPESSLQIIRKGVEASMSPSKPKTYNKDGVVDDINNNPYSIQ